MFDAGSKKTIKNFKKLKISKKYVRVDGLRQSGWIVVSSEDKECKIENFKFFKIFDVQFLTHNKTKN